jgi:hypothetical protein
MLFKKSRSNTCVLLVATRAMQRVLWHVYRNVYKKVAGGRLEGGLTGNK